MIEEKINNTGQNVDLHSTEYDSGFRMCCLALSDAGKRIKNTKLNLNVAGADGKTGTYFPAEIPATRNTDMSIQSDVNIVNASHCSNDLVMKRGRAKIYCNFGVRIHRHVKSSVCYPCLVVAILQSSYSFSCKPTCLHVQPPTH